MVTPADREADEKARQTGEACAEAAYDRGERLTDAEAAALVQWTLWGSDSYPVRKLGRRWTIEHPAAAGAGLYPTKRAAVLAWETLIYKWIRLKGLQQQAKL